MDGYQYFYSISVIAKFDARIQTAKNVRLLFLQSDSY